MPVFRIAVSVLGLLLETMVLIGCSGSGSSQVAALALPVAAFSATPSAPSSGQSVSFNDASTGTPTSWSWNFGDGSAVSTVQNPTHIFTTAGSFTVTLTATNTAGSSAASRAITVSPAPSFSLTSSAGPDGGILPIDFTLDGSGASPDLTWTNPPAGTQGYALLMTTLPGDGSTLWNWVLYNLPGSTMGLAKNSSGIGTSGLSSHTVVAYAPPQSVGPGLKQYTFTLYALSSIPDVPNNPSLVTGDVLTHAIGGLTLGSTSLNLSYSRTAPSPGFSCSSSGLRAIFASSSGLSTTTWMWSFGDGATSTAKDPTHTFQAPGTYLVTLTVGNEFGSNAVTRSVIIAAS